VDLEKILFQPSEYPEALCNDGTSAGYYYVEGSHPGRAIIYLMGGGLCYDEQTCASRSDSLKSNKYWTNSKHMSEGLFNRDCHINPYFCNATIVFVPYCSSDTWVGDRDADQDTWGMHFKGSHIVHAVLDRVSNTHLKDHKESQEILWSGSSAGGSGAAFNMHRVLETFPNAKSLNDSDWLTDYIPMDKSTASFVEITTKAQSLTNGQLDPACVEHFNTEPWKCMFNFNAEPFYKMPRMTQAYLYDSFGLGMATANKMSYRPSQE
jgi:hypothetical protein